MQINIDYNSSVTSLETSDPTLFSEYTGAVNTAVQTLENDFTNPVTLTINVGWGEFAGNTLDTHNGILAQNWANGENVVSLAMTGALLTSNATTSAQEGFVANLPSGLPDDAVYINEGEATALGLIGPTENMGSVGLNSAYPYT